MLAALDAALDALAPPVFGIALSGRIVRANALARVLLAREGTAIQRSLAMAAAHGPANTVWDLKPFQGAENAAGFLAIRRPPTREIALADALRTARRRWKLTARQVDVLELVARGLTNDVIAEVLRINKGTVEFHLSAIRQKVGASNRATLIVRVTSLHERCRRGRPFRERSGRSVRCSSR